MSTDDFFFIFPTCTELDLHWGGWLGAILRSPLAILFSLPAWPRVAGDGIAMGNLHLPTGRKPLLMPLLATLAVI